MDKIEQLLNSRAGVELQLEKLKTPVAILFTDIKGSTSFFETHGDVEGLALVHRHNTLLFPLVTQNRGRVVKTVGDAIMACFSKGEDALRAAIAMQQALRRDNERHAAALQIHIRIGLHAGLGIVKNGDVYGDVVNTASRVEHESQPDEIYISEALTATARLMGAQTVEAGEAQVKGKSEKVKLWKLDWRGYAGAIKPKPAWQNPAWFAAAAAVILAFVLLAVWPRISGTTPDAGADPAGDPGISAPVKPADSVQDLPSITHEQLADLLFQDDAIQEILSTDGQTVGRDELMNGMLRGLQSDGSTRTQPVTRAEMALVLEDLWIRRTGKQDLATNKLLDAEQSPFEDIDTTRPEFNAVVNVTEQKWLEPESEKIFNPSAPVRMADVQEALKRFFPAPGRVE